MDKLGNEEIDWFLKSEISSDLEVKYCCSDEDENSVKNRNSDDDQHTVENLNIIPQHIGDFLGNIYNALRFECDNIINYFNGINN